MKWLSDPRVRSTVLINAASILEKSCLRALMQALSSPVGGVAGHFYPRNRVIAVGCVLWACMELLFSTATSIWVAMPIAAVNGVGLSLSLTADLYSANQRGRAFGALWLTISLGGMLGALYATNVAAARPFGLEGWRFVFASVAVVSATVGLLNAFFVQAGGREKDPSWQRQAAAQAAAAGGGKGLRAQLAGVWAEVAGVLRIPTFLIIILQETVALYALTLAGFAVLTAWPAPCTNNPIFAEIVPVRQRNLVYSFDRCFEGAIAAFSVPLVGLLAQRWFGFAGTSTVTGNRATDLLNARALGSALLAFLTVPWTLCFLIYSILHWTYPRDRHAALVADHVLDGGTPRGAAPARDAVFVPVRVAGAGGEDGAVALERESLLRRPDSGASAQSAA
eukprot:scaffold2.g7278.t1